MWLAFLGAVLASVVLLYVPGYLIGRAFFLGRFASVAVAPAFTGIVLVVLGVALGLAGITCPAYLLAPAALVICALPWVLATLVRRVRHSRSASEGGSGLLDLDGSGRQFKLGGLYIGVAVIVALIVYIVAIGDPSAFSRHDDSTFHLAAIRGFMDTGTYSVLDVSAYLDQGVESGFYPGEWYIPVAVVASLFGGDVVMANNAVTLAFLVFVFPLAMCLLMGAIFPDNTRLRYAGSLFSLSFCGFPWGFLVFGQLLPNMMAFMFVPMALALVIGATNATRVGDVVKLACAVFIVLLAVAFAQPNGAFTFGIWAVLYGVSRMFYAPGSTKAVVNGKRVVGAVVFFVAACAVWAFAYNSPVFESVVQRTWEAMLRPHEAIAAGLLFIFTWRQGMQPFLTVVVLIGVVCTFKDRRYLWLSVAYIAALAFYVIDMSTMGVAKQVLTGFWYTDYNRTGAMTALFAMPLATLGFVWLYELLERAFGRSGKRKGSGDGSVPSRQGPRHAPAHARATARVSAVPLAVLVVVMAACQFAPYSIQYREITAMSGLPKIQQTLAGYYSWEKGLTREECAFVERALAEIPEGSLIVNAPRDGSCWVYGVEGANVFFRRTTKTARDDSKSSKTLRTKLCDISTNEKVRNLVNELDARYVLMLDAGSEEEATTVDFRYVEDDWRGIESITEDTPGFTLLLSEGDMRLYRIDA